MLKSLAILLRSEKLSLRWVSYLIIATSVISSVLVAVMVAQGRMRSIAIIFTAILALIVVVVGPRIRYQLFLVGIFLSLFAPTIIPYGISLGELVLTALFLEQVLASAFEKHSQLPVTNNFFRFIPFVAFAGYSLVVNLLHDDFAYWHGISFAPLLCVSASWAMIKDAKRAWVVVRTALLVIFGFLLLMLLANITGRIVDTYGDTWRLGGQTFAFGPFVYIVYSVHLGGLVALGVPALVLLLMHARERLLFRLLYGAMLIVCFAVLVLTAARGPLIGALVGACLAVLLSFRLRKLAIMFLVLGLLIILLQPIWSEIFPAQNVFLALDRFSELQNYSVATNFVYRLNIFDITFKQMMHNPFGFGYEYLWRQYGYVDEANIYTPLINGTGIIGLALWAIMICQFAWVCCRLYLKTIFEWVREFATLGISTLVVGLISGISAHNIIIWSRDSIVFWSILSACYSILLHSQSIVSSASQEPKEILWPATQVVAEKSPGRYGKYGK